MSGSVTRAVGVLGADLRDQSFTFVVPDVAWSKRSRIAQADSQTQSETVRQSGGDYASSMDQMSSMLHLGRVREGRRRKGEIGGGELCSAAVLLVRRRRSQLGRERLILRLSKAA